MLKSKPPALGPAVCFRLGADYLFALVAAPFAAPLAALLAAPFAAPFAAPLAAPFAAPLAAPFAAPLAAPLAAQERPALAENPLAQLKDEVQRVLADAGLPFNVEQEKAIVLMMEDRRKASEDLFGGLMDFRAGPTRGDESDRLRSAIEWMRSEFLGRLQDYLTLEQLSVWSRYVERGAAPQETRVSGHNELPAQKQQNQTQYVRINNNAFTAEDGGYCFGNRGAVPCRPQQKSPIGSSVLRSE